MIDQELKKAIIENKETLEKLDQRLHRIEKKFIWNTIFGFLKVIIIWGPIIIGVIYLTPILKDYVKIFDPLVSSFRTGIVDTDEQADFAVESFCDPEAREVMVQELCQ